MLEIILPTTPIMYQNDQDYERDEEEEEIDEELSVWEMDRYSNRVIAEFIGGDYGPTELSDETIEMAQYIINVISILQSRNNIVLCQKNRRCIVEEICEDYGRGYNADTALSYANYVIDGSVHPGQ